MKDEPTVSVVIPTRNRSASLRRTLDALRVQTYSLQQVEVIVVCDGCTDGTVEMLRHYRAPFTLHTIEQPGQGAATARNQGTACARGQILLFLDDDVEPTPSLIEAHVRAHQQRPEQQVVIGPYPPALQGQVDFVRIELRAWWEDKFHAMRQSGYRYTYRDLLSGNLSLEAELFTRVGGFDPTFPGCGGEDYEFGVRLIKAGALFTFTAEALGYHHDHESTNLERHFQRGRQEGYTDVLIGLRHPELRPMLKLAHLKPRRLSLNCILRILAFGWPTAGDALVACIRPMLDLMEWARLYGRWRQLCGRLRIYWYWRGVAQAVGTQWALINFLQGGPASAGVGGHEIELDLREGLEAAEQRLDEERPASARIRYGKQPLGRIPPQAGAERLRGVHLRRILATDLAWPLVVTLALEGAADRATGVDKLLAEFCNESMETVHADKSA